MKKIKAIFLLFLYLLSSAGVTISAHYCGGNLAALSIFDDPSCCCDNMKAGKKDDCCKNENKSLKITADQNKVEFAEKKFQPLQSFEPMTQPALQFEVPVFYVYALKPHTIPLPPDSAQSIPAYKRNHAFLFYC